MFSGLSGCVVKAACAFGVVWAAVTEGFGDTRMFVQELTMGANGKNSSDDLWQKKEPFILAI